MAFTSKKAVTVEESAPTPPRDADVLRVAGAMLGALWCVTPFKAGPEWEARADIALNEAERLIAAYDKRRTR
jgi:hypothetical protein